MDNGFYTVRAFYRKEGRIKYISHLDMNRCISRDLKRSGLPVWHTLGFNSHIYLTFALPLSLGYESLCDSFDFRLTREMDLEMARKQLAAVLPEGLTVYRLAKPVEKPEKIAFADYDIFQEFCKDAAIVQAQLKEWLSRPEILLEKKTKKSQKEIDVKPLFTLKKLEAQGENLFLSLRCSAGGTCHLNPTFLLDAFAAETGNPPDWARVIRTAVLNDAGEPWV
ncbi:MAG: DUF2344 domain-containing protein [Oscillospiraceae bacterium]|nr:DUF2344 domain-containing protein [Oscillospiraceae bacterium]